MKTWIVWGCTSPDLYVRAENIFDALKKAREFADDYLGAQELPYTDGRVDMFVDFRCRCDCETCAYRNDADGVDDDLRERTDAWADLMNDDDPIYCDGHTDKYTSEEIAWSFADKKLTVWVYNDRKSRMEPRVYDLNDYNYYFEKR